MAQEAMPATAGYPGRTRRTRRFLSVLAAVAVLLLVLVPAANAKRVSVAAKRVQGKTVVFRVAGIAPIEVRSAKLRVGAYRKRISASRMRRAARRGKLRVRLPRRVAKRLRRGGVLVSRHGRRWPRLTVVIRPGAVYESGMSFETGNFSEATSLQNKRGSLDVTSSRAYEGRKSARATWFGGGPGAQRVWKNTDWKNGTDVWYGMAVYVPANTDYCYWNPIRWDNYDLHGGPGDDRAGVGDVGGVSIEQNRIYIMKNYYGGVEQKLVDGGTLAKGRWTWLELHQKFSDRDGAALSELYVDGVKKGSSTKANSAGRPITDLRAGVVNVASSCSTANAIDFDRVSISNTQRGPLSG